MERRKKHKKRRKKRKVFIIDASVLQSAGETEHPISKSCRDVLFEVYEFCHKVGLTERISDEWKHHYSNFSKKWHRYMNGKGGIENISVTSDIEENFKEYFKNYPKERDERIVFKDIHLIEAALKADKIILSRDSEAKNVFNKYAERFPILKRIRWVDPTKEEDIKKWIKEGAPIKKKKGLGY